MKRSSETISFRADKELARLIDESRCPFGISRGDWVRGVVIARVQGNDALERDAQITDLRRTLDEMQVDAQRLQSQIRRVTFTLLTILGQGPQDEAKAIVHKIFLE
jgi:hypothetical protein